MAEFDLGSLSAALEAPVTFGSNGEGGVGPSFAELTGEEVSPLDQLPGRQSLPSTPVVAGSEQRASRPDLVSEQVLTLRRAG